MIFQSVIEECNIYNPDAPCKTGSSKNTVPCQLQSVIQGLYLTDGASLDKLSPRVKFPAGKELGAVEYRNVKAYDILLLFSN